MMWWSTCSVAVSVDAATSCRTRATSHAEPYAANGTCKGAFSRLRAGFPMEQKPKMMEVMIPAEAGPSCTVWTSKVGPASMCTLTCAPSEQHCGNAGAGTGHAQGPNEVQTNAPERHTEGSVELCTAARTNFRQWLRIGSLALNTSRLTDSASSQHGKLN